MAVSEFSKAFQDFQVLYTNEISPLREGGVYTYTTLKLSKPSKTLFTGPEIHLLALDIRFSYRSDLRSQKATSCVNEPSPVSSHSRLEISKKSKTKSG